MKCQKYEELQSYLLKGKMKMIGPFENEYVEAYL